MVRVDQRLVQVQNQNLPLYSIWRLSESMDTSVHNTQASRLVEGTGLLYVHYRDYMIVFIPLFSNRFTHIHPHILSDPLKIHQI